MPSAVLGFSARARRGFVLGTRCALCYVRLFCESKKGFCTGHEVRVVFLILFLTYAGFAKPMGSYVVFRIRRILQIPLVPNSRTLTICFGPQFQRFMGFI